VPNLNTFTFDKNGVIKALLMAPPGKGKTTLALTFPRPNVMDFDGKVSVGRNPWFIKNFGIRSIEYEQFPEPAINNPKLIPVAFDNACKYFDKWMAPGFRDKFDTWIIDSGTSLSMVARAKGLYVLGKAGRSKTNEKASQTGMAVMEYADWGAERSLVEQFCRMILDSGKNVIINVHEKEITKDGVMQTVPLFTGDSKTVIPSMVPDVWHLRDGVKDNKMIRVLVAEPIGSYQIRSELGIDRIEEPSYDKIVARIKQLQDEAVALTSGVGIGPTPASQPAIVAAKP
jgi:hypothetical protein